MVRSANASSGRIPGMQSVPSLTAAQWYRDHANTADGRRAAPPKSPLCAFKRSMYILQMKGYPMPDKRPYGALGSTRVLDQPDVLRTKLSNRAQEPTPAEEAQQLADLQHYRRLSNRRARAPQSSHSGTPRARATRSSTTTAEAPPPHQGRPYGPNPQPSHQRQSALRARLDRKLDVKAGSQKTGPAATRLKSEYQPKWVHKDSANKPPGAMTYRNVFETVDDPHPYRTGPLARWSTYSAAEKGKGKGKARTARFRARVDSVEDEYFMQEQERKIREWTTAPNKGPIIQSPTQEPPPPTDQRGQGDLHDGDIQ